MDIGRISPIVPVIRVQKYDDNGQKKRDDRKKEKEKEDFKNTLKSVKYEH